MQKGHWATVFVTNKETRTYVSALKGQYFFIKKVAIFFEPNPAIQTPSQK